MENDYLKKQNTRFKCRPQAQLRTHNRKSLKACEKKPNNGLECRPRRRNCGPISGEWKLGRKSKGFGLRFYEYGRIGLVFNLSFNIQDHTIGIKWLRLDEHGRIGLISNLSFNIQNHTIGLKYLRFDEHGRIGLISNLSFNIQSYYRSKVANTR